MKELTELDRQCVKCFAQSNMNGNEAARRMFVGRSTLSYHLEQVEIKTGLNPKNFFELVKLLEVLDG